jgi:hypothetical protein
MTEGWTTVRVFIPSTFRDMYTVSKAKDNPFKIIVAIKVGRS